MPIPKDKNKFPYMLNTILFERLREQSIEDDNEGGTGTIIKLSNETISVIEQLADSLETLDGMRRKHRGRCEISAKVLCASLKTFTRPSRVSVWIEIDENDTVSLCCCSKDVDVKLMKNVWNRLRSHVLTYAVPEMLIKLRQGAGRLIRCESDTGLLSILDARASSFGNYRERVLNTLAKYPLVESIDEAEQFMMSVKSDEYYKN